MKAAVFAYLALALLSIGAEPRIEDLISQAIASGEKRDFATAARGLTRALEMEAPRNVRYFAHLLRATARRECGDRAGGMVDFADAIALMPEDPRGYLFRGDALRTDGRTDEALADYLKASELAPAPAEALVRAGALKYEAREYPAAIEFFSRALKADPSVPAYYGLCRAKADGGDFTGALAVMDALLAIQPKEAEAYHHKGAILYAQKATVHLEPALEAFNKAIELNPNRAIYYRARANCRSLLGDSDGARADVETFNALNRRTR